MNRKAPTSKRFKKTKPSKVDPGSVESELLGIVGIGSSAGGLEALEQFLGHVKVPSPLAFVIVQHQDPSHKGLMPELLQRATKMKVISVTDRTKVVRNCVYVIPPNKDMSVLNGVLHLLDPAEPRGLRLPINFFFRSLGDDQRERSIGVILSGMGGDGTVGLRAIKERGGVTLVQDPLNAKFDSMPRSAIDAGLADIVASVEGLPGMILQLLRKSPAQRKSAPSVEEKLQSGLEKVVLLLRIHTGHDFSLYKQSTLYRRIERRMGLHRIEKMPDYVRYLHQNTQELELLFKELLIGVTSFFRDNGAWDLLIDKVFTELLSSRPEGHVFRAWVPGCSTGEEAYSLAIALKESAERINPKGHYAIQIFATDLNPDAIDKARQGSFSEGISVNVSAERLVRYFAKVAHGYRIRKEIREMVVFATQDLIMDPPFTKLDVVSCRNLLIYLAPEMQKKLIPLFHYALNAGGVLFLGSAETIGLFTQLFSSVNSTSRIFQKKENTVSLEPIQFPPTFSRKMTGVPEIRKEQEPQVSLQVLADQYIIQRYSPPAAVVNSNGDIIYISGRTGRYLEPAAGKANWNVFAMIREGLRNGLAGGFQKALREPGEVRVKGLEVVVGGGTQFVELVIQQIAEEGQLKGLIILVFLDQPSPAPEQVVSKARSKRSGSSRVEELEKDLDFARREAQATRADMQTSQEELRSTNEELQSTNEEVQSTNEELMTSKEEMQSMNEELQTVNAELQTKIEELSRTGNDMKNLLNSTDIATLFLDSEFRVRRFTTQATKLIKLIPSDVGRPITDLSWELRYPELKKDGRAVLKTLVSVERVVASEDGRWFNVRVMPYQTIDESVDGLVFTFADITAGKKLEADLRRKHELLKGSFAEQTVALKAAKKTVTKSRKNRSR